MAKSTFGPVRGPDMAIWCQMLNDTNAIHLSQSAAEAAGFGPRRVNPGPANMAYAISALMHVAPDTELAEITAFFAGNVFEEDLLHLSLAADGTAEVSVEGREDPVLRLTFKEKS